MAVFCQSRFSECYAQTTLIATKRKRMSIHQKLSDLVGSWKGTNRLYTPWLEQKLHESPSTANVRSKMNGQFLSIEYTWSHDGEPQEGLLVLGCDPKSDAVQAVWTDSWHSKNVLMLCNGTADENGNVSVTGYYSVPENPDWGWRTELHPASDSFLYRMYNISPDGDEDLAVETDLVPA